MAIKGLLFDKDGTLIDFKATFEPATRIVLQQLSDGNAAQFAEASRLLGFDPRTDSIADDAVLVAGSGYDIALALKDVFVREDVLTFARELDHRYGIVCAKTVTEIPDAVATLKRLQSQNLLLAIATNDAAENAATQMTNLGIRSVFSEIYGADSGFGGKPDPGMINAFLESTGFSPAEVMMIGDSTHDLEAGRAAQVVTCGVESGPATRDVLEPLADHIIPSISDLPDLISGLNT